MIVIGELALWVALLMAAWSTAVSYAGGMARRDDLTASGARALYATFAMLGLAAIGLWTALLSRDFSLEYVAGHTSLLTPRLYAFTAFWLGRAGALLFPALVLSLYGTIAIATSRRRNREIAPWVTGTVSAILLFLLATTCFAANPFARMELTPLDGRGMDPRLQNPAMAVYQPSLYLGYAATAVAFAFAIAALLTRRLDAALLDAVRRWTLLAWFFLTIAVVLGVRYAYIDPESMGDRSWIWDAIRNPSIFPWLATAASLHFFGGRRRVPRKWNLAVVGASFLLSIFAALTARVGLVESEPSSAQSAIATWLSSFFFLAAGMTVYLVGARLRDLKDVTDAESAASTRRRYGGHVVHAGILMLLVALAGVPFARQYDTTLKTGQSFETRDPYGHLWRFVSQGVSQFERADHVVAILGVDTYRDGKRVGLITSEKRTYRDVEGNSVFSSSIEAGIHSTAMLDTYLLAADIRRTHGSDVAELRIAFNPLVAWIWAGGLVMVLGGLMLFVPNPQRAPAPMPAPYVAI
jgi:cytochrome c biogenesis factor